MTSLQGRTNYYRMLKIRFFRCSIACCFLSLLVLLPMAGVAQTPTHVVISQVYGGGGNSRATYKNDFIELFNPTASTETLTNYSVQYASSTGSFSSSLETKLPTPITLAPGQYYLIQEAAGTGGTTNLPTPDAIGSINMSATGGKVALVGSQTALTGTCPTADPTLVDFIGFGTSANCYLGAQAPAPSNTTADLRTNVCIYNGNNSTDFSTGAPTPRNSATTLAPCPANGAIAFSATGLATPSTFYMGSPTLLTVTVTAGTLPTSTGITVVGNLSSIGGSSTQSFYDDGTNGDLTAGDGIYSYSTTVATAGTYSISATASDAQSRTATVTIPLTVQTPPPNVTIQTIQALKPSAYAGQAVTTSGIVVGVSSSGIYLEQKNPDANPASPEGLLVYTGSTAKPSYIALGAEVQVMGTVSTYPTTSLTPDTEIDAPQTFSLLSTGNALPAPIVITAAMDSPTGGIRQFAPYEGMRVAIGSLTTTSGTGATLTETTETNVSNGQFYGVVTGVARPFREPGISVTETTYTTTIPSTIPRWDSNPELLDIDSAALGGTPIDLTSNATLTGLVGVMDFSTGAPEILLDAATPPTVSGLMTAQPVPAPGTNEFTVASFNMERFYNDIADADNPGSSAVVVTTAAYQRRLTKASLAIRNILLVPDIVGVQEIENQAVLTDLANKISADAIAAGQPDPLYQPYTFLANDGTAINTGMLVKSTRVDTINFAQLGLTTTFTNSTGSQAILNDRTPLVVQAGIKRAGGPDYPVTVISVHQRSLSGIDDPTSTGITVRLKREAQAEYLAEQIQGYQAAGQHVICVGDYNAFEFSDGFVDTMGVTLGTPIQASEVITTPTPGLANPALVDLVTLLPAAQRQSYVESGSAQVLDHVVVTQDLVPTETRLVYAHMDSDFPLVYLNDATRPERVSDHDPAVAYFLIPPVAGTVTLATRSTLSKLSGGGYQAVLTVSNSGTGTAMNVQLTGVTLGSASGAPVPQTLGNIGPNGSASVTVTFPASAGASGSSTTERYSGSYTGGSFSGGIRATLP